MNLSGVFRQMVSILLVSFNNPFILKEGGMHKFPQTKTPQPWLWKWCPPCFNKEITPFISVIKWTHPSPGCNLYSLPVHCHTSCTLGLHTYLTERVEVLHGGCEGNFNNFPPVLQGTLHSHCKGGPLVSLFPVGVPERRISLSRCSKLRRGYLKKNIYWYKTEHRRYQSVKKPQTQSHFGHSLDEVAGSFLRETLFPSSGQVCNTNKNEPLLQTRTPHCSSNVPPPPDTLKTAVVLSGTWTYHVSGVHGLTSAGMKPSSATRCIAARKDTCYWTAIKQYQTKGKRKETQTPAARR